MNVPLSKLYNLYSVVDRIKMTVPWFRGHATDTALGSFYDRHDVESNSSHSLEFSDRHAQITASPSASFSPSA